MSTVRRSSRALPSPACSRIPSRKTYTRTSSGSWSHAYRGSSHPRGASSPAPRSLSVPPAAGSRPQRSRAGRTAPRVAAGRSKHARLSATPTTADSAKHLTAVEQPHRWGRFEGARRRCMPGGRVPRIARSEVDGPATYVHSATFAPQAGLSKKKIEFFFRQSESRASGQPAPHSPPCPLSGAVPLCHISPLCLHPFCSCDCTSDQFSPHSLPFPNCATGTPWVVHSLTITDPCPGRLRKEGCLSLSSRKCRWRGPRPQSSMERSHQNLRPLEDPEPTPRMRTVAALPVPSGAIHPAFAATAASRF